MGSRLGLNIASRIMIPVNFLFDFALGLTWALQEKHRTSMAISAVRAHGWTTAMVGWLLVGIACVIVIGYFSGSIPLLAIGCGAGAIFFLILGIVLFGNAGPRETQTAPLWPLYVAFAHLASFTYLGYEHGGHGA